MFHVQFPVWILHIPPQTRIFCQCYVSCFVNEISLNFHMVSQEFCISFNPTQVPYNMERLFYLFAGGNHDQVAALMHNMETEDCVRVPSSLHDAVAAISISKKISILFLKKFLQKSSCTQSYSLNHSQGNICGNSIMSC